MQDYVIDHIKDRNLTFDYPGGLPDRELMKLKNFELGLEPMAYFFFKLAFEDDNRQAHERIEYFNNFDDFLPISTK